MARYGLLIDYNWCTGCHSCEVACQQEHDYPVGTNGIVVTEYEYEKDGRVKIDYLPFVTDHCDLCTARLAQNEQPACVKHCQAACMEFGFTDDLSATMKDRSRVTLYTHTPDG